MDSPCRKSDLVLGLATCTPNKTYVHCSIGVADKAGYIAQRHTRDSLLWMEDGRCLPDRADDRVDKLLADHLTRQILAGSRNLAKLARNRHPGVRQTGNLTNMVCLRTWPLRHDLGFDPTPGDAVGCGE